MPYMLYHHTPLDTYDRDYWLIKAAGLLWGYQYRFTTADAADRWARSLGWHPAD